MDRAGVLRLGSTGLVEIEHSGPLRTHPDWGVLKRFCTPRGGFEEGAGVEESFELAGVLGFLQEGFQGRQRRLEHLEQGLVGFVDGVFVGKEGHCDSRIFYRSTGTKSPRPKWEELVELHRWCEVAEFTSRDALAFKNSCDVAGMK